MTSRRPHNPYRNRRVTVMGLGRFGGGAGAVRFLADCGARVVVTDLRSEIELAESLAQLDGLPIERLTLGRHERRDFDESDLVVVNPAVRPGNEFVRTAVEAGVPITTEVALFVKHQRGRVVGVTGTTGKSTTATMIRDFVAAEIGNARLGGNVGGSLLGELDDVDPRDWTILELSSFQLTHLDRDHYSPNVAVVTNFHPNHLDWHGSVDEYASAKRVILRWQSDDDVAVLNEADAHVSKWSTRGRRIGVDPHEAGRLRSLVEGHLRLPGEHVRQNAVLAATAAHAIGVSPDTIARVLDSFQPLPHRLQDLGEIAGRRFLDDSKSTTPESVEAALASFDRPIVLLAGGYDKGVDLHSMACAIRRRAKAVALMGQTAPRLAQLLRDPGAGPNLPKKVARSFQHAWEWALEQSCSGDVVLLSPGCASFDWFRDFEDRGRRFQRCVADFENVVHKASESRTRLASPARRSA